MVKLFVGLLIQFNQVWNKKLNTNLQHLINIFLKIMIDIINNNWVSYAVNNSFAFSTRFSNGSVKGVSFSLDVCSVTATLSLHSSSLFGRSGNAEEVSTTSGVWTWGWVWGWTWGWTWGWACGWTRGWTCEMSVCSLLCKSSFKHRLLEEE